jgi:D-lactate dehydrogenase
MKTLVYSTHEFDKPFLEFAAENKHHFEFTESLLSLDTTDLAKGYAAIALFTSDQAPAEVLEKLNYMGVKFLALRSVGYDHVDIARAKALGMSIANVPAYSPQATAEHAVTLLMALNRKIVQGQRLIAQNDFRLDTLTGFNMYKKTVGIIGTGKIGASFAKIMHGFGCKLLGFDIEENTELKNQTKISYTTLAYLCNQSDVISIHCPLNSHTHYMFDKPLFDSMKRGVVLINTARGGIVNTEELLQALDDGIVSAAGLDVYENEKPIFFHNHRGNHIPDKLFQRLRNNSNVLITGHQAFLTKEALQGIAETTVSNLDAWDRNEKSENELS